MVRRSNKTQAAGLTLARNTTPSAKSTNTQVSEHFDLVSAQYADSYSWNNSPVGYLLRRRREIVLHLLEQRGGGVLLDAGCGPGLYSEQCVRRGFHYYGLDASSAMIAEADRQYGRSENVSFQVGSIESIPFREKSFDVVLALGVLEYLDRARVHIAMAEFRRVLKPGGILIISLLNRSSVYALWMDWAYPLLRFCLGNAKACLGRSDWIKFGECKGEECPTHKHRASTIRKLLRALLFRSIEQNYFAVRIVPKRLYNSSFCRIVTGQILFESLANVRGFSWLAGAFITIATRNDMQATGLPREASPVSKLESGAHMPALGQVDYSVGESRDSRQDHLWACGRSPTEE